MERFGIDSNEAVLTTAMLNACDTAMRGLGYKRARWNCNPCRWNLDGKMIGAEDMLERTALAITGYYSLHGRGDDALHGLCEDLENALLAGTMIQAAGDGGTDSAKHASMLVQSALYKVMKNRLEEHDALRRAA